MPRTGARTSIATLLVAFLAACGGGGGGGSESQPTAVGPPIAGTALRDGTAYSSAAGASLARASELASVTSHSIALGAATVAYTASAGHLDARDPRSGGTEASMFYVAYTVSAPAAARPLVFFFNGGPGRRRSGSISARSRRGASSRARRRRRSRSRSSSSTTPTA
jgi:hypothetical protein